MSELSDEEISLQALYDPSKKVIGDIEDGIFSTPELQPRIKTGIDNLQLVTKLVNQMRLFSSNEQVFYRKKKRLFLKLNDFFSD